LAALLGEEVPESLKDDSEGKEILVDILLLLILNAADIIEELGNFAPNNRISILWPRHGWRLERRTGEVWRCVGLKGSVDRKRALGKGASLDYTKV
jgi:hypothetical protein